MNTKLLKAIKSGTALPPSAIEDQCNQARRTRISPLADEVINAVEKGEIILLHLPETEMITKSIPFIVMKTGAAIKAFVFVDTYGKVKDDPINIGQSILDVEMKSIYALLESAFVAMTYQQYPAKLTRNAGLMKICLEIYTTMAMRLLNKQFSLTIEPDMYNRVAFCMSKFFLNSVWELSNTELSTKYAISPLLNPDKMELEALGREYDAADIDSIEDVLEFITKLSPRFSTLNIRYYMEQFINTYHSGAVLAMDTLPYFLFVVMSAYLGCYLINQPIVYDIIKHTKGSQNFYTELTRIV